MAIGWLFLLLAVLWALQLGLAYQQAQAFMARAKALRRLGRPGGIVADMYSIRSRVVRLPHVDRKFGPASCGASISPPPVASRGSGSASSRSRRGCASRPSSPIPRPRRPGSRRTT